MSRYSLLLLASLCLIGSVHSLPALKYSWSSWSVWTSNDGAIRDFATDTTSARLTAASKFQLVAATRSCFRPVLSRVGLRARSDPDGPYAVEKCDEYEGCYKLIPCSQSANGNCVRLFSCVGQCYKLEQCVTVTPPPPPTTPCLREIAVSVGYQWRDVKEDGWIREACDPNVPGCYRFRYCTEAELASGWCRRRVPCQSTSTNPLCLRSIKCEDVTTNTTTTTTTSTTTQEPGPCIKEFKVPQGYKWIKTDENGVIREECDPNVPGCYRFRSCTREEHAKGLCFRRISCASKDPEDPQCLQAIACEDGPCVKQIKVATGYTPERVSTGGFLQERCNSANPECFIWKACTNNDHTAGIACYEKATCVSVTGDESCLVDIDCDDDHTTTTTSQPPGPCIREVKTAVGVREAQVTIGGRWKDKCENNPDCFIFRPCTTIQHGSGIPCFEYSTCQSATGSLDCINFLGCDEVTTTTEKPCTGFVERKSEEGYSLIRVDQGGFKKNRCPSTAAADEICVEYEDCTAADHANNVACYIREPCDPSSANQPCIKLDPCQ